MAISKTQPMRPAEIQLVDAVNNLLVSDETQTQEITTVVALAQSLQNQIGDGFSETSVSQSLSATNRQILGLTNDVDQIEATLAGNVNVFINRFRVGHTGSFEIAAGNAQAGSVTFNTPYADTAQVCVFLCCVDPGEIFTNLECRLISATYSGFSYNIVNNDQTDAHTVALGFVAAQVN